MAVLEVAFVDPCVSSGPPASAANSGRITETHKHADLLAARISAGAAMGTLTSTDWTKTGSLPRSYTCANASSSSRVPDPSGALHSTAAGDEPAGPSSGADDPWVGAGKAPLVLSTELGECGLSCVLANGEALR